MAPEKSKSAQDKQDSAAAGENPKSNKTATTSLEEDDEFEDFPVDGSSLSFSLSLCLFLSLANTPPQASRCLPLCRSSLT